MHSLVISFCIFPMLGNPAVADPGEGPRRPAPLIFRPKWGPKGRKKIFWRRPPPLSQSLDDRPSPLIWRSGSVTVQDILGFWTPRRILYSRYWIPIFSSGTWILDSKSLWDSGFLERYWYSRFQSPGFQIPRFSQILASASKIFLDSGIRIQLHGAK